MFTDEDIGDLSFEARWLFAGLFTQADREGRLEDRPRKLKVEVMPYDDVRIEDLLRELTEARFITRYQAEGKRYIHIRTFWKHQHFNVKEPPSQLPEPPGLKQSTVPAPYGHHTGTMPAPVENAGREGKGIGREGKEEERAREARGEMVSAPASAPPPPGFLSESFVEKLQAEPAYSNIEVRYVYAKMLVWCERNGKDVTENRLINWLNQERGPQENANGKLSDKEKIRRVVKKLSSDRNLG